MQPPTERPSPTALSGATRPGAPKAPPPAMAAATRQGHRAARRQGSPWPREAVRIGKLHGPWPYQLGGSTPNDPAIVGLALQGEYHVTAKSFQGGYPREQQVVAPVQPGEEAAGAQDAAGHRQQLEAANFHRWEKPA